MAQRAAQESLTPGTQGLATDLARRAQGGPIENSQILAFDANIVTFRYRNHRDLGPAALNPEHNSSIDEPPERAHTPTPSA